MTSVGKLYALDSFDRGTVLWSYYFGTTDVGATYKLFELRGADAAGGAAC
eukprot:SAG11_NODE_27757_length_329_cov_0.900000_1_plen_49_part_01